MHKDKWTTEKGVKHETIAFDSVAEAKKHLGEKETLEHINRAYRLKQLLDKRKAALNAPASA